MATTFRGVRFAILILAGLLAGVAGPARADEESAKNFVTQLGNEAVSILKPENAEPQRQAALETLFRKAFDFDTISRAVVGPYWNKATPEQQAEYRKVFEEYVVTTYARRLAPFTLSGFSISGAKGVGKQDVLVETVIERPDDPALNYGWRVREEGGGSKLVDVVVEGVSLMVTHRADFTSVLQRDGMDGLIATLKQKTS